MCFTSPSTEERFWEGTEIPTTRAASRAYAKKMTEPSRRCRVQRAAQAECAAGVPGAELIAAVPGTTTHDTQIQRPDAVITAIHDVTKQEVVPMILTETSASDRRRARGLRRMAMVGTALIAASSLVAVGAAAATPVAQPSAGAKAFAKRFDIGNGRSMYLECRGTGSPTVLLISGTDTASDLWHAADQKGPKVYPTIAKTTRVCAYDRPGAPHLDGTFSKSDPVPQPTSPQDGVDDLDALLAAADVPGPYVLAAHSFGGTIARVFAAQHPDQVVGIVFIDVLTPELRAQMTPEEWSVWVRLNARPAAAIAAYPELEQQDFDETLDQVEAAEAVTPLKPMPAVVLTASHKFADVVPKLIENGELPPDAPKDFGVLLDRTNPVAQRELAALVPGAVHITNTKSGHNIMVENAPVVIRSIRRVVDAVRAGRSSLTG